MAYNLLCCQLPPFHKAKPVSIHLQDSPFSIFSNFSTCSFNSSNASSFSFFALLISSAKYSSLSFSMSSKVRFLPDRRSWLNLPDCSIWFNMKNLLDIVSHSLNNFENSGITPISCLFFAMWIKSFCLICFLTKALKSSGNKVLTATKLVNLVLPILQIQVLSGSLSSCLNTGKYSSILILALEKAKMSATLRFFKCGTWIGIKLEFLTYYINQKLQSHLFLSWQHISNVFVIGLLEWKEIDVSIKLKRPVELPFAFRMQWDFIYIQLDWSYDHLLLYLNLISMPL